MNVNSDTVVNSRKLFIVTVLIHKYTHTVAFTLLIKFYKKLISYTAVNNLL